jgi:hypothetical protein
MFALWNRPRTNGVDNKKATALPPADSPKMRRVRNATVGQHAAGGHAFELATVERQRRRQGHASRQPYGGHRQQ